MAETSERYHLRRAAIIKKPPRQSREETSNTIITIKNFARHKDTKNMEHRNPFDLIFRLFLLLLCAVVFAAVCVGCKPKEILRESTDTVYVAHDITRIDTIADTLHDSIYIREIVTAQGEVQYKEKVVYRDNTKVKYRDRVVRDTIYKTDYKESANPEGLVPPRYTSRQTWWRKLSGIITTIACALICFWAYIKWKHRSTGNFLTSHILL